MKSDQETSEHSIGPIDPLSIQSRKRFLAHLWDRREWDSALLQISWGLYVILPWWNSLQAMGLKGVSLWMESLVGAGVLCIGIIRIFVLRREGIIDPELSRILLIGTATVSMFIWIGLSCLSFLSNLQAAQGIIYLWLAYRSLKSYMRGYIFS